jgi:hypothetical protein
LQPSEVQKVIAAFSDVKEFREHGIHINNVKYLLLRGDDRSIYGKKVNYKENKVKDPRESLLILFIIGQ